MDQHFTKLSPRNEPSGIVREDNKLRMHQYVMKLQLEGTGSAPNRPSREAKETIEAISEVECTFRYVLDALKIVL